jgi:hypothetical protein
MRKTLLAILVALGFISSASVVKADTYATNIISISLTAFLQNNQQPPVKGIANTPAPIKYVRTTAFLLQCLAQDKHAQGQYVSTSFPVGAKLAIVAQYSPTTINPDSITFSYKVLDKYNHEIVDVSDIVIFTLDGTFGASINNGPIFVNNSLYAPKGINQFISTITFDDTFISGGSNLKFYLSGVTVNTVTDSFPSKTGVYTETQTTIQTGASGDGYYNGVEMIVTGGFTSSSTSTLNLP